MAFLVWVPVCLCAQKLKVNDYDRFEKKRRLETFPVNLRTGPTGKIDAAITYADSSFYLKLTGTGVGTNTIDEGTEAVFFLDADSSVTATSPSVQSLDFEASVPGFKHEYRVSFSDLEKLSRHDLMSLRKYSAGGFDDITIEKKNTGKMKDLTLFFVSEVRKAKLVPERIAVAPPGFPGGNTVLVNFLNRNLKPTPDLKAGETKTAIVKFKVMANGNITDLQVKQSAGDNFDNELLRILARMPNWKPAVANSKAIDYDVTLPVVINYTEGWPKIQL